MWEKHSLWNERQGAIKVHHKSSPFTIIQFVTLWWLSQCHCTTRLRWSLNVFWYDLNRFQPTVMGRWPTACQVLIGFDQEYGYFKDWSSLTEAIKLIRLITLLQISQNNTAAIRFDCPIKYPINKNLQININKIWNISKLVLHPLPLAVLNYTRDQSLAEWNRRPRFLHSWILNLLFSWSSADDSLNFKLYDKKVDHQKTSSTGTRRWSIVEITIIAFYRKFFSRRRLNLEKNVAWELCDQVLIILEKLNRFFANLKFRFYSREQSTISRRLIGVVIYFKFSICTWHFRRSNSKSVAAYRSAQRTKHPSKRS